MGFWEWFKNLIFTIIEWLYGVCGDWGLAIILITVLFRLLIFPIAARQNKSSYAMQKMQPKIKEIQEKYADDRTRQNEELMKVYSEANFNPLSGCLPLLLQMPLMMALFQVLRELTNLITESGLPETVLPASFYGILPDLSASVRDVFSFTGEGIIASLPYIVMLALFSLSMMVPMLTNPSSDQNTKMMMGIMAVVMLVSGTGMPAGVLLYWDTSSLIGIVQTQVTRVLNERRDAAIEEEMVEVKPVKVEVVRKERKSRPRKSR